ncbi:MAG: YcxB family protein [Oscillospiraceae bacterium]|nr:YcxB family protein [Oscillospiraceae bacterium]
MPDLKAAELEKKEKNKKNQKIIADFSYDNSLEETDDAMKTFQKSFSSKRGKLSIVAYSLLAVAAIVAIVFNSMQGFNVTQIVLYFALAFCSFGLYYSLTEKKRMRRKVIETLKNMNPEDYHCTIFDNRIEIETIIKEKEEIPEKTENETEENVENSEVAEEKDEQPIKSVFKFGEDMLDFIESDMSLLLILARRQIYCFPKRCLSDEQQSAIRDFLTEKLSGFDF